MMHEKAIQLSHASNGPDETRDISGLWRSQHGSEMRLIMEGNDISGTFTTYEGVFRHHVADIKGVAIGDLTSLTALWRISGSITSWSGQFLEENGHAVLKLMWRLITEMAEPVEPRFYWMSSFGGAEDFVRQPADAEATAAAY